MKERENAASRDRYIARPKGMGGGEYAQCGGL
jgi:hypothetical protein